ncbi:MAG: hypothetical protein VCD31_02260 [Alphaproteobacteria bacterium]
MVLVYLHLWFAPYAGFKDAIARAEWPVAAANLNKIRFAATTNIGLGLINAIVGASGRYWS